jgi:CheY-like chemotaxis protein
MGKKILLADDSITIQKVISITFSSPDYEITIVDNGNDAIKKASDVKPDIVLTDIVMPGKNGYEVCDAIKGNPGLQNVPVLLLTGAFEAFDEQKAKQAGADAWLSKPFETQALIDKVNTLLSKPAVKKPAEARPAVSKAAAPPPPLSKPGTPPPPPPRRPTVSAPTQPPKPMPVREVPQEHVEEIKELSEEEAFGITEDAIGDESGWETIPLGDNKETPAHVEGRVEELTEEELPSEQFEEPALAKETSADELSVGFGDLEAAMEEEEPKQKERPSESYEKNYEVQEISKPVEERLITHNEAEPAIGLSKEELLEQASGKIESLLRDILPGKLDDAIKGAVESKVEGIVREVAEKIIWEVVPALTETMIKEEIQRLKTTKKKP